MEDAIEQLNFHQLYLFYVVARHRSFSRAAKELRISQPAVSIQVQDLEKSLGTPLFQRRTRELHLTPAGETVYEYAQRIFSLAVEMREAVEDIQGLRRGNLTVGASTTPGEFILPAIIGQFHQKYPQVQVKLVISNTQTTMSRILQRELDLGMVGDQVSSASEDLVVSPYLNDEIVLVAAPSNPLARQARQVTLQEVMEVGLLMREPGSATRKIAEEAFLRLGVVPNVVMELGSNQAVKQAAIAGLGVGVVSRNGIKSELMAGLLNVLEVKDWECFRMFYIIYLKDRHLSAVQRAFLNFLEQEKPPCPTPKAKARS